MKILSAEQLKQLDAASMQRQQISSYDLMERAASCINDWLVAHYPLESRFLIVCGNGNNGGDGMVVARQLIHYGYKVKCLYLPLLPTASPDFETNKTKLQELCEVKEISTAEDIDTKEIDYIIDALLGYGTNRKTEGLLAECIAKINQFEGEIISIDMPSGLPVGVVDFELGQVVKAHKTLSFEYPKLTFLLPQFEDYVGDFVLLDIGLDKEFTQDLACPNEYTTREQVQSILPKRKKFSHKGHYGHALLIGGSFGKIGAVVLAAKACVRSGAGLVTAHVPRCGYEVLQTAVPECMASVDTYVKNISQLPNLEPYQAIGIGPGLGRDSATVSVVENFLDQAKNKTVIIDADAINLIAEKKVLLSKLPKNTILTPHAKEFQRMVGTPKDDFQRLEMQAAFSKRYQVFLVYKGAHSTLSTPDGRLIFNSTGNPGMASGGSGDVLAGIILGLLAQKIDPEKAAIMGMYMHGLAGDLAKAEIGETSLIPSDMLAKLGEAFARLER